MGSIILLAVGIAVATALLGSLAFSSFSSSGASPFLALEEKCEKIALEGYKYHLKYPESDITELPASEQNALIELDNMWINDCVNRLPASTVFNIIQKVELEFYSGE